MKFSHAFFREAARDAELTQAFAVVRRLAAAKIGPSENPCASKRANWQLAFFEIGRCDHGDMPMRGAARASGAHVCIRRDTSHASASSKPRTRAGHGDRVRSVTHCVEPFQRQRAPRQLLGIRIQARIALISSRARVLTSESGSRGAGGRRGRSYCEIGLVMSSSIRNEWPPA